MADKKQPAPAGFTKQLDDLVEILATIKKSSETGLDFNLKIISLKIENEKLLAMQEQNKLLERVIKAIDSIPGTL